MRTASISDVRPVVTPQFPGMTVYWLCDRERTGSQRAVVGVTDFEPGASHEVHRHPNCESASFVIAGAGEHHSDGPATPQAAGEAVLIPTAAWHGFGNPSQTDSVRLATVYGAVGSSDDAGYEVYAGPELVAPTSRFDRANEGDRSPVEAFGLSLRVLFDEQQGAASFVLGVAELRPNQELEPRRFSEADLLLYLLAGQLQCTATGFRGAMKPDELAYIPAGQAHALATGPDEAARMLLAFVGVRCLAGAGYQTA